MKAKNCKYYKPIIEDKKPFCANCQHHNKKELKCKIEGFYDIDK